MYRFTTKTIALSSASQSQYIEGLFLAETKGLCALIYAHI